MRYDLPTSVTINEVKYAINTDFRCILDIMEVLSDNELTDRERAFFALGFFYPEVELKTASKEFLEEAVKQFFWFINGGEEEKNSKKQPKVVDWQQDFPHIIAPVNRVFGHDIRSDSYVHWWTFLSAYMEIGECLFSQIVSIRHKRATGKKLEKYEKDWYRQNRKLVDFKVERKYTAEDFEFFKSIK